MVKQAMNRLPLQGVRVIEFCEVAAGPFCGMLLADLGAEVIKVERPGQGDTLRQWPPITAGYSENFASLNRNKRSITLDLKDPEQRAIARQVILSADAVIENYRPGVMSRHGLDHASLAKDKPAIVYCSISAFGQSGPRSSEGGFDLTIQAMAGVMSITGEPDSGPVKCGVPLADFVAGLYGALYVVSALRTASADGNGAHIDVPMLATTLAVAALQTSEYFGTGRNPRRLGSAHPRNAPYRAFKALDGYFVMAAGNDRLWKLVTETIDRPEIYNAPEFVTTTLRAANQERLKEVLERSFAKRTVADLVAAFTARGVPCSPVNTYADVLADPQVEHLGLVQALQLPGAGQTRTVGCPVRINGEINTIRSAPPALGEHNPELGSFTDRPRPP